MENPTIVDRLPRDIWLTIVENALLLKPDLCSLCLTCRWLHEITTPALYRHIPLVGREVRPYLTLRREKPRKSRLYTYEKIIRTIEALTQAPSNAALVQTIELRNPQDMPARLTKDDVLAKLVTAVPNLRFVIIPSPMSIPQTVLAALNNHPNKPELHLGIATNTHYSLPSLPADVYPHLDHEYWDPNDAPFDEQSVPLASPNREMIDFQAFFFSCPNLATLSLSSWAPYGERQPPFPPVFPIVTQFRLTGRERCPRLRKLRLNGYAPDEESGEWDHWAAGIDWTAVRSLHLGPQLTVDFLAHAVGVVRWLQELTIEIYDTESEAWRQRDTSSVDGGSCATIERFLLSFSTLRNLSITGFLPSVEAISAHSELRNLRLHDFEPVAKEQRPPQVLRSEDVAKLNEFCPLLEELEIDLYRDGTWPRDVPMVIASNVKNLSSLTFVLEVGPCARPDQIKEAEPLIAEEKEEEAEGDQPAIEPPLTPESARTFGRDLFSWRCEGSRLRRLVMKTGDLYLRRWPHGPRPGYAAVQRLRTGALEVTLGPRGEADIRVKDVETPERRAGGGGGVSKSSVMV